MIRRFNESDTTFEGEFLAGSRMTADEFLQIIDEGHNYELIDGVVSMTPSPAPKHQSIAVEIVRQLANFLDTNPIGEVLMETDLHLGQGRFGGDLVYRPEVVFYRTGRMQETEDTLQGVPDVVVEIISRGSRRLDTGTKKADYERLGVGEYWLIDPKNETFTVYRLEDATFAEMLLTQESYSTNLIPGFTLDVVRIRQRFHRRQS